MKVTEKEIKKDNTTYLADMNVGDLFVYEGDIHMKTYSTYYKDIIYINLRTGKETFVPGDFASGIKVNGELTWWEE